MHNLENIHIVEMDCKVCGFHKEENAPCVTDNVKFYFRYLSQLYVAETCIICENRCNQFPHFFHVLGEYQYYDEDTHRSECECTDIEGRAEESHNYVCQGNILVCIVCGHTKETEEHEHGYGLANKWEADLIYDIIMTPAYGELVDAGQISNPKPDSKSYCSRYDFKCKTCGARYSCYFAHEDDGTGKCARGYCEHMQLN